MTFVNWYLPQLVPLLETAATWKLDTHDYLDYNTVVRKASSEIIDNPPSMCQLNVLKHIRMLRQAWNALEKVSNDPEIHRGKA